MPCDFRAPANAKSTDHERRLDRLGATFVWQQTQCRLVGVERQYIVQDLFPILSDTEVEDEDDGIV
jgi:hypothetical protein